VVLTPLLRIPVENYAEGINSVCRRTNALPCEKFFYFIHYEKH
jgi:hypothetical protein